MSIAIPAIALPYLGAERFGLWVTAITAVTMLSFADFGVANGLVNFVANASGRDAIREIREGVSNATAFLLAICIFLLGVTLAVAPLIPWARLLKVEQSPVGIEAFGTVLACMVCFAISLPLSVVERTQRGLQLGHVPLIYESGGSLLSIPAIAMGIGLGWETPALVLAQFCPLLLARLANSAVFWLNRPEIAPRIADVNRKTLRRLTAIGGMFFVIQIASTVAFQTDVLIIAYLLGAESVSVYSITLKIFSVPSILLGLFTVAQWPAYAEAWTRQDHAWIRTTLVHTSWVAGLLAVVGAAVLVPSSEWLVHKWVGMTITPSMDLRVAMGIWSMLLCFGTVTTAIFNGLHLVRFQTISAVVMAVANLLLSIFLVSRIGVSGAVFGSIIAYTAATVVPSTIVLFQKISEVDARQAREVST